jgi:ABC-type transporter Mla MlaB component
MNDVKFQLETIGETATLYVHGELSYEDFGTLISLCDSIHDSVRTLRLDLHGVGQLSAEATYTVRLLLKYWRETRRGEFRLTTSHMLATLRNMTPAYAQISAVRGHSAPNDALQATYL